MNKEDLKRKAIELHSAGNSYGKIAEQLRVGKTTVYNWITSVLELEIKKTFPNAENHVPNIETTSPNLFENEINDLNEIKQELENEFGTDKDINTLVELRKAELEHKHKMERLEMERQTLLHNQKMETESIKTDRLTSELEEMRTNMENAHQKSERLDSTINQMKRNNEILSLQLEDLSSQNQIIELDEGLLSAFNSQIGNYLDLEGNEITITKVKSLLEEVEKTIKHFKKWVKKINGNKTDYPELTTLKKLSSSLFDMSNQFEHLGEDELIFEFNSDFEKELKYA